MVGVYWPMVALSMHMQKKPYLVIAVILPNKYYAKLSQAFVQYVCIVLVKYWINSSKAAVGGDRPIKALFMHVSKGT